MVGERESGDALRIGLTPIILSGQSLININNVSYVEIQHIKLDWYDGYGVQVQGTSDHLWLANLMADSQVPNATVPIGFYVHPSGARRRYSSLQHRFAPQLYGVSL